MVMTAKITIMLSTSPMQAEMTADRIKISTRKSANCPRKICKTLFCFPARSSLAPYFASRLSASA